MAEEVATTPVATVPTSSPTKKVAKTNMKGEKKPKTAPTHPPTADMVKAAIKSLKERNGSSLPAIKTYIATEYKVDTVKLAPFIKKSLKSMVEKKALVQTKGVGASGSFKLPAAEKKVDVPQKEKKAAPKKEKKAPKAEKKAVLKKVPKAEKKVAPKKAKAPKTEKKKASKPEVPKAEKKGKALTAEKKATKPKVPKAKKPVAKKGSAKK
jgi:hypothetical protein